MKLIAALLLVLLNQTDPVVSKDSVSIHVVRKGNMALRLILAGSITSMEPARAIVTADATASAFLRIGQVVRFGSKLRRDPAAAYRQCQAECVKCKATLQTPCKSASTSMTSCPNIRQ